ncbi:unnamed protein product, partial [Rotaria magnacalcarata]
MKNIYLRNLIIHIYNLLKRFVESIFKHQRLINNASVFSDEIFHHLFASDPSSLTTAKMIRDQYERLFIQQHRIYELTQELCDSKEKENLENKRKLMFYQGTLHSQGLIEEFLGYLQGVLQPNSAKPMSS